MAQTTAPVRDRTLQPLAPPADLGVLDAMARLAGRSGAAVNVVVPRAPGVLEHARTVAARLGVTASADLMAHTIRVRFAPRVA